MNSPIYLTNGTREVCNICKRLLIKKQVILPLKKSSDQSKGKKTIETVLFCTNCCKYYITQAMCKQVVKRHKQYYIEVSTNPIPANEDLAIIGNQQIRLCNKEVYLKEGKCPIHNIKIFRKLVKVDWWKTKELHFCPKCKLYYVEPTRLEKLNNRILEKAQKENFIKPENVMIFRDKKGKPYYIAECNIDDMGEYVPLENDLYYEMSEKEVMAAKNGEIWIEDQELEEVEINIPMKEKSILGEKGYTVNKEMAARQRILQSCVDDYGKGAVVSQIEFNIRIRQAQKNGEKYARAISIWEKDIEFVRGLSDDAYVERQRKLKEVEYKEREKRWREMIEDIENKTEEKAEERFWWQKDKTLAKN